MTKSVGTDDGVRHGIDQPILDRQDCLEVDLVVLDGRPSVVLDDQACLRDGTREREGVLGLDDLEPVLATARVRMDMECRDVSTRGEEDFFDSRVLQDPLCQLPVPAFQEGGTT